MVRTTEHKRKDSRTKRKANYKCNYCGKSMLSKETLYEHLKRWHKMLAPRTKKKLRREYDRE